MAYVTHYVFFLNVDIMFDCFNMLQQIQRLPEFECLIRGSDTGRFLIYLIKYANYAN